MPNPKGLFSENWSEHHFVSSDGTPIFYRRYLPSGAVRGQLLILHGMGEHGGRYREVAEALGGAGLEIYVPDLRGFGRSGGKRGCLRHFREYFYDLDALLRVMRQRAAGLPFFILAHSFGGLVAVSWLAEEGKRDAKGLVLTSPNFGISIPIPLWRRLLAVPVSIVAPDATQDNRVDRRFLTHDTAIFEQHKMDRFNHHRISARLYREMKHQFDRKREIAGRLKLPVLLLQAGDDRLVSQEDSARFFEALASQDKELEVFPGLYHEILNETSRQAIYAQIEAWIKQRL